ncbi:Metallothionein expression activator [Aspergillus nanangensis]|uniref:Metallothionein expression activator n=1 Tax=Aspergillus nanangensis TaxID=2582783 RepID=A0AAD4CQZ8_ASPNN|nr:Metallothionein expression activator [Aspergillus nanangensis]
MISSQHRNSHERHRQHRRQISTPSAFDAAKMPSLPTQALHRYHAHRRGQSFDQRSLHVQPQQTVQDGPHQPHPVAGEAQLPQRFGNAGQPSFHQHSASMSMVPECQSFSQEELQALSNRSSSQSNMAYLNPGFSKLDNPSLHLNMIQQQQHLQHSKVACNNALEGQMLNNGTWGLYQSDRLAPSLSHQASDIRRLSAQSDSCPAQRPHTPKQANTHYLPITPATTPFKKPVDLAQYEGDIQSTPSKDQSFPVPNPSESAFMQRARSLQGVAGTTFSQQKFEVPSPPNTASFDVDSFDAFDYNQESSLEIPNSENMSHYPSSLASSSFHSSPELAAMPYPQGVNQAPKIPIYPVTPSRTSLKKSPSTTSNSSAAKPKLSPRVASIDNLNLDNRVHASIKETGVTIDEIASYISGPEPEDGKWMCLHPGCGRRFGRKENIKSHVQTHLGDRQYKCDHCNKCFVRGHDLKRHAKIHTGDKPYECLCGNVFARHDALTRHRQRGMCIGGYKGIVRKTTKRGRPKKHRPEMDERQDKASRTRQRMTDRISYDSSSSDISHSSPPSEVLEHMSLHGSSPAEDMPVFGNPNYSLPPEVFTYTPPASPGGSVRNKPSPTHSQRSLTPCTEDEMPPLSPSKQPLHRIVEESGLPLMSAYTGASTSTINAMSSPHTAPTLSESSHGSDLDIFISQDPSTGFGKHEFSDLSDPDMASFPDYVNGSSFEGGMDLFPGKGFSTAPSMNDDFFSFQFQVDEQPSDVMTREFFMD